MTSLWRISGDKLQRVVEATLSKEEQLEKWIAEDPAILGLDIMLIGRQVPTDFGGRIDLLGINREGEIVVIELKRSLTPREVVAQVLDYASWVSKLSTKRIHELSIAFLRMPLAPAFRDHFEAPLPEALNSAHSMIVVASALDPSSQRIVEYLAEECGVNINTAFFNFFNDGGQQYLTADWLMDQDEVAWKAEAKTRAPWGGVWYANVEHGPDRAWEDMVAHGFLAAGGGRFYSKRLDQLGVGDPVFAYQKKFGYVGYGVVNQASVMAKDFLIDGNPVLTLPLRQPALAHDKDNPDLAEYLVGMNWKKTFPLSEARTFAGAFANQNVVCRLKDVETLDFLKTQFGASP